MDLRTLARTLAARLKGRLDAAPAFDRPDDDRRRLARALRTRLSPHLRKDVGADDG